MGREGARAGLGVEDLNAGIPGSRVLPQVGARHSDEEQAGTHRQARSPDPRPGGDVGNVGRCCAESKGTRTCPEPPRPLAGAPCGRTAAKAAEGAPGAHLPPSRAVLDVDDGTEGAPGLPTVPALSAGSFA